MNEPKQITHLAYTKKREGRTSFRWLEVGAARVNTDGKGGHDVYIDRLPVGGFSGHIHLSPIGVKPEEPIVQPHLPGDAPEEF